jgi:iron-sulfur cluster repair protein YtfE (RIC family)
MRPRALDIDELITLLETEHERIRSALVELHGLLESGKLLEAMGIIKGMDETLIQHMLDEEATLLRAVIRAFGREGARESIEVFQEHVEIDSLIKEMKRSINAGDAGLTGISVRLSAFLNSHFQKEQTTVFPCVREAERKLAG